MELDKLLKTLLASASLAAILAATPLSLDLHGKGLVPLKASFAYADSGSGSDGDDDDDEDEDDEDDDDDEDEDDDEDDDDDDEDDDEDDDDDDDDDNSGRDKPRIPGGSGCDDPEDVAEHPECGGVVGEGDGDSDEHEYVLSDGTKVEISDGGKDVEVKYPDGSSEEIESGQYERKDTTGDTVEERPATAEDYARLQAVIDG